MTTENTATENEERKQVAIIGEIHELKIKLQEKKKFCSFNAIKQIILKQFL